MPELTDEVYRAIRDLTIRGKRLQGTERALYNLALLRYIAAAAGYADPSIEAKAEIFRVVHRGFNEGSHMRHTDDRRKADLAKAFPFLEFNND